MRDRRAGPTTEEIEKAVGRRVSKDQRKYWSRMGLISEAHQDGLEGQFGTEVWYDAGTEAIVGGLLTATSQAGGRNLENMVWAAWASGRRFSEMRPAILELFARHTPDFRKHLNTLSHPGRRPRGPRATRPRPSGQAIGPRHRSPVAYVVAVLILGAAELTDAGLDQALIEVENKLNDFLRHPLSNEMRPFVRDALRNIATEAELASVRADLVNESNSQLDSIADRMWSLWRPMRATGVLGDSSSWFPFFLLLFIAYAVSPSASAALRTQGALGNSAIEMLVGLIRSAHLWSMVSIREDADPRSPVDDDFGWGDQEPPQESA